MYCVRVKLQNTQKKDTVHIFVESVSISERVILRFQTGVLTRGEVCENALDCLGCQDQFLRIMTNSDGDMGNLFSYFLFSLIFFFNVLGATNTLDWAISFVHENLDCCAIWHLHIVVQFDTCLNFLIVEYLNYI